MIRMENINNYSTVEHWLNRLAPSTAKVQTVYFRGFMKWVKENGGKFRDYTPDMLIEYQRQADNGSSYDILDMVQKYLSQCRGRQGTKIARYANIKSFFAHNRIELPRDPTFKIRSNKEPVRGTLTPDEIKQTILACNKAYRAVYLTMFQSSMDQEMFIYWNNHGYDSLMGQLNKGAKIIKIDLPGRKANRNKEPYYTFIGHDAIEALKNWLEIRPKSAKAIITNQYGEPLKKTVLKAYWTRQLRRIGIIDNEKGNRGTHRTGKSLHEMRDVWRSLWSKSSASHVVGEYLMGHSIDEYGYDKSFRDVEYYRKEYAKALPYLELMSRGEPYGRVDQSEVEKLRAEVKRLESEKDNDLASMKAELADLKREMAETIKQLKDSS